MNSKLTFTLALALALAVPDGVFAQNRGPRGGGTRGQDGGGGGGRAVGRPSGGASGGDRTTQPTGGGSTRGAAPAPSGGGNDGARSRDGDAKGRSAGGATERSGDSAAVARGDGDSGRPGVGRAVPRGSVPTDGGTTVIVRPRYWGGLYPWGYGGFGIGGYYAGFYDPWWGYDTYAGGYGYDGFLGSLRLKVRPREASVYVDGYFAGQVDDFDGVFQRLKIEEGPHRIELREDGYEPLMFEVRILPDRTVTYKGTLDRLDQP